MGASARQAAARRSQSAGRARTPAPRARRPRSQGGRQQPEVTGLALIALGCFLASVLWLGWDGGVIGEKVGDGLRILVGAVSAMLPSLLVAIGGLVLTRSELVDLRPFRAGMVVLTLTILLAFGAGRFGVGPGDGSHRSLALDDVARHGGEIGGALALVARTLIGEVGTSIVVALGLACGFVLVSGASIGLQVRRSAAVGARAAQATARLARRSLDGLPEPAPEPRRRTRSAATPVDAELAFPDLAPEPISGPPALLLEPDPLSEEPLSLQPPPDPPSQDGHEPRSLDGEHENETPDGLFAPHVHPDYRLPARSLLRQSPPVAPNTNRGQERVGQVLVQTLADFGIAATVVGQVAGPRVTRFELQLAPGTKVSKVSQLKDDLAYALATTEIRILAPIPGKQAVGVEVPNLAPNVVTLGDVTVDLPASASPLSVWLGKDISGEKVWADLARMPHILIAGTTGSGKSGCINGMLCSILLRATPDDVRMILIDPKRVELSFYESIPHLLTPVVSSPKRASAVLANVVEEMERRYERMSVARSRNIVEFNKVLERRGEERLPYLLVVIDELADLMMVAPQDVEEAIIRLAQKSRAVGIHLVLATQRPSVDVITGMIKANVPSRIAFAVSSQTDSRVILDGSGAESLLGQGDMLYKPLGTSRLQRVQGAYVTEDEVAAIVAHCRSQRSQELDESLLEAPERPETADAEGDDDLDPDEDPLLQRAIEVVVQAQTASVSLLQRRLRVGYTRAGRLVDMLERRGIISGYEGSKARRVLATEADLDVMREGATAP